MAATTEASSYRFSRSSLGRLDPDDATFDLHEFADKRSPTGTSAPIFPPINTDLSPDDAGGSTNQAGDQSARRASRSSRASRGSRGSRASRLSFAEQYKRDLNREVTRSIQYERRLSTDSEYGRTSINSVGSGLLDQIALAHQEVAALADELERDMSPGPSVAHPQRRGRYSLQGESAHDAMRATDDSRVFCRSWTALPAVGPDEPPPATPVAATNDPSRGADRGDRGSASRVPDAPTAAAPAATPRPDAGRRSELGHAAPGEYGRAGLYPRAGVVAAEPGRRGRPCADVRAGHHVRGLQPGGLVPDNPPAVEAAGFAARLARTLRNSFSGMSRGARRSLRAVAEPPPPVVVCPEAQRKAAAVAIQQAWRQYRKWRLVQVARMLAKANKVESQRKEDAWKEVTAKKQRREERKKREEHRRTVRLAQKHAGYDPKAQRQANKMASRPVDKARLVMLVVKFGLPRHEPDWGPFFEKFPQREKKEVRALLRAMQQSGELMNLEQLDLVPTEELAEVLPNYGKLAGSITPK